MFSNNGNGAFFKLFNVFLSSKPLSPARASNYLVLEKILRKFELYSAQPLDINTLSSSLLDQFVHFMRIEHTFFHLNQSGGLVPFEEHQYIYNSVPETRPPRRRGDNYISALLKMLRTFIRWCNTHGYTDNYPFRIWHIESETYGTPYFITIEERDRIFRTDFTDMPHLARQRDVFVFQCCVGCRIGDLYSLNR